MNIGLLLIGDELLSGRIHDANGKWLASYLAPTQFDIGEIKIIRDIKADIKVALDELFNKYDIVLTSGGLGPTDDDITKFAVAEYYNKELVNLKENDAIIETHYARINKEWKHKSNNYHLMPKDFTITNNPCGLAPGMIYEQDKKIILCAPGVPREFQQLFNEVYSPFLENRFQSQSRGFSPFSIRTYSVPEEAIFTDLCPTLWKDLEKYGKVSSLPLSDFGGVDIVVTLEINEDLENKRSAILNIIEDSALAKNVWQIGNLSLEEYVVKIANEKNKTISFAESCTGGLTASKITDVSGSSAIFLGSIVSYANSVKTSVLGVQQSTLDLHGAVSEKTALEMAVGARKACGADISISFTGIAGPGGGSDQKPVGTVGIGWSFNDESDSKIYNFTGDRLKLKQRFSNKGLMRLLEILKGL